MFSVKKPLPFHDASALFLIWLTALMSFIAVLILTASLGMTNVIGYWNRSVSGSLTIQVPTFDLKGQDRTEAAANDVRAIETYLLTKPAVKSVRILSDAEMANLIEPWMGKMETRWIYPCRDCWMFNYLIRICFPLPNFKRTYQI